MSSVWQNRGYTASEWRLQYLNTEYPTLVCCSWWRNCPSSTRGYDNPGRPQAKRAQNRTCSLGSRTGRQMHLLPTDFSPNCEDRTRMCPAAKMIDFKPVQDGRPGIRRDHAPGGAGAPPWDAADGLVRTHPTSRADRAVSSTRTCPNPLLARYSARGRPGLPSRARCLSTPHLPCLPRKRSNLRPLLLPRLPYSCSPALPKRRGRPGHCPGRAAPKPLPRPPAERAAVPLYVPSGRPKTTPGRSHSVRPPERLRPRLV